MPPHAAIPQRRHTRLAHGVGAAPVPTPHCATRPPVQLFLRVFSHDASQDTSGHRIRRVDIATGATTTLAGSGSYGFLDGDDASARFNNPYGVAIDPTGTFTLVAVRAA